MARLGDHVELSTSRFLKCRERLSRSTPSSHKIFSSDGDQLLESERLIHKCIWRYIDKAPYAGFTGNARIHPTRMPAAPALALHASGAPLL